LIVNSKGVHIRVRVAEFSDTTTIALLPCITDGHVIGIRLREIAVPSTNSVYYERIVPSGLTLFDKISADGHRSRPAKTICIRQSFVRRATSSTLHEAARRGNIPILRLLLKKGAAAAREDLGAALGAAVRAEQGKCIQTLLDHDADTEFVYQKATPLAWAVLSDHETIAQLMLSNGANPEWKFEDQENLLAWASRHGRRQTVQLLLAGGANPNVMDRLGQTPIAHARRRTDESLVELLRNAGARS
jgi:hypothetical protein